MDALVSRRSCRLFTDKEVSKEVLDKILYAGICAPSAKNRQNTKLLVFQDKEAIKQLSKLNARVMNSDGDPFYGAPIVVVVFYPNDAITGIQDASLVMGNLMNEAYAQGVGSCWINRAKEMFEFDEGKEILKKYGLENYVGVGCCILGDPTGEPREKTVDTSRIIYE